MSHRHLSMLILLVTSACAAAPPSPAMSVDEAAVPVQEAPVASPGELDSLDIARALKAREDDIMACYAAERESNPEATGIVVVEFQVTPTESGGVVTDAFTVIDEVGGEAGPCLTRIVADLDGLPAPRGGVFRAALPFRLQASGP